MLQNISNYSLSQLKEEQFSLIFNILALQLKAGFLFFYEQYRTIH